MVRYTVEQEGAGLATDGAGGGETEGDDILKYACESASPAVKRSQWSYRSSLSRRSSASCDAFGLLSEFTNFVHGSFAWLLE